MLFINNILIYYNKKVKILYYNFEIILKYLLLYFLNFNFIKKKLYNLKL